MPIDEILSNEKAAIAASADSLALKPALEKLAASLEALEPASSASFISHVKSLPTIPSFYGSLPTFPKKPTDPYEVALASGDLPTHDSEIEYEDNLEFYKKECKVFANALAKACREFSLRL